MRVFCILMIAAALTGCASNPNKITPAYVPPAKYAGHSCEQITAESNQIRERATALYKDLKSESNADAWQAGIGAVLFLPVLLTLEGGDDSRHGEYARLLGELEAMDKASSGKKCGN